MTKFEKLISVTKGSDKISLAYDFSGIYQSLSDEANRTLHELGVPSADANALSALSFENVMAALYKMAGGGLTAPLKGLVTMTAVLLLCSMLTAYQNSLTESGETVQTVAAILLHLFLRRNHAQPHLAFITKL